MMEGDASYDTRARVITGIFNKSACKPTVLVIVIIHFDFLIIFKEFSFGPTSTTFHKDLISL